MIIDSTRPTGPATSPEKPGFRKASEMSVRTLLMAFALIPLMIAVTWMIHLESSLPDVRAPRGEAASERLPGRVLAKPGEHNIVDIDTEPSGEWILQEVGDATWLATEQAGASQRVAFYGSEVYLIARIGPDAGRAFVRVNGRPVENLPREGEESFVGLWAGQAANRSIILATGLAHGEHTVEVFAAGDGEVAIAGFDVVAQTPFSWAFVLAYSGLVGGLFLVLRYIVDALTRGSDTGAESLPDSSRPGSESR